MKLCKDCKYLGSDQLGVLNPSACDKAVTMNKTMSPVTGEWDVEAGLWSAGHMRRKEEFCGEDAKWFEQRDPTWIEKLIGRFKQ